MIKNVGLFKKPKYLINKSKSDIGGVITYNDLKKTVEDLCMELKHPVTVLSLYDYILNKDNNKKMIRIISNVSSFFNHYCCDSFRICGGKELCEQCDINHAELFKGENDIPIKASDMKSVITNNIKNYINTKQNSIFINNISPKPEFILFDNNNPSRGGYLKYYCPFLGFIEFLFPIIISDRILGVVFRGQVHIKNSEEEYIGNIIRKNFLKKHNELFDKYFFENSNVKKNELINDLLKGEDLYKVRGRYTISPSNLPEYVDEGWAGFNYKPDWNSNTFNEHILNICNIIENINDRLKRYMLDSKISYISHIISLATNKFYENVMGPQKNLIDKENINSYWEFVKSSFHDVVYSLDLKNIQIYGASTPRTRVEDIQYLNIVAFIDTSYKVEKPSLFDLKPSDVNLDYPLISSYQLNNVKSIVDEKLCDRIFDKNTADYEGRIDAIYYLVTNNLPHSSVIAIEYYKQDDDELESSSYKILKDKLLTDIHLFSTGVFYISSYLLNSLMQMNTEKLLRFFNHELSHAILGFNFFNEMFIKDFDTLVSLDECKRKEIESDFVNTEEMMKAISKNIDLLIKPIDEVVKKVNKEEICLPKDILFKWQYLYRLDLEKKKVEFKFPESNNKEFSIINSDKRLLEHIIHNIINNAIKYCYWGTKIILEYKPYEYNPNSKQLFTVLNYGTEIETGEKGEQLYELYYRNINYKFSIEGSGIGLFVVRRIASILGITVKHTCKKISNYNIGILDEYLRRNIDKDLNDILIKEKERLNPLHDKAISSMIINDINYLSDNELESLIRLPTYEVVFLVII